MADFSAEIIGLRLWWNHIFKVLRKSIFMIVPNWKHPKCLSAIEWCNKQYKWSPKDVKVLTPGPVNTSPNKGDFADVIKLRTLKWKNYAGLFTQGQCKLHGSLISQDLFWLCSEKEMWIQRNSQEDAVLLAWRSSHEPRNAGTSRSWKRQGKGSPTRASRKECSPAYILILANWGLYWTSYWQICKIIHLCCFKPLNVRCFIITASEN